MNQRTRRDVGKPECQKDPIFLFQRKSGKHWETEWVFFTREEGEEWGRDHAYNYPRGWRVFCVSALGELADVLRMPEQQAGLQIEADADQINKSMGAAPKCTRCGKQTWAIRFTSGGGLTCLECVTQLGENKL